MGSLHNPRKPPHQKTFGMEIECYPNVLFINQGVHVGFWAIDIDMSLYARGREFISQPMPYNMLRAQIKTLNKKLNGWRVGDECGLHIHVSRKYWSEIREAKFSKFLRTLMYSELHTLFGRVSRYADPQKAYDAKYRAVNVLHEHTYEFRLWKAGDVHWTLEALRRTKLIVEYRGDWSYEACLDLFTKAEK